jgi:ABC-type molybdate transport system substrate-binding protein
MLGGFLMSEEGSRLPVLVLGLVALALVALVIYLIYSQSKQTAAVSAGGSMVTVLNSEGKPAFTLIEKPLTPGMNFVPTQGVSAK